MKVQKIKILSDVKDTNEALEKLNKYLAENNISLQEIIKNEG